MYKIIRTYKNMEQELVCTVYCLSENTLIDLLQKDNVLKIEAVECIDNKVVAAAYPSNEYVTFYSKCRTK